MLVLKSIAFTKAPKVQGLRFGELSELSCEDPPAALKGWQAIVRGSSLVLVSPPGWAPNNHAGTPKGVRKIHEVPRNNCFLAFEGDLDDVKAVMDLSKTFTSPPFGTVEQAKEIKSEDNR